MNEPTFEQKLITIPVLCQILVEFIEDTGDQSNVYRQELKHHAKGLVKASDKFLEAVYGYAKVHGSPTEQADEQNEIALQLKNAIANGLIIEV